MAELYRHFDQDGGLLYVGISNSTLHRLKSHKRSSWFDRIRQVHIEPFETRVLALAAERKAIREEKPEFNIQHTKSSPLREKSIEGKKNRVLEYFVEDHCHHGSKFECSLSIFAASYRGWCKTYGIRRPKRKATVGEYLKYMGFVVLGDAVLGLCPIHLFKS